MPKNENFQFCQIHLIGKKSHFLEENGPQNAKIGFLNPPKNEKVTQKRAQKAKKFKKK